MRKWLCLQIVVQSLKFHSLSLLVTMTVQCSPCLGALSHPPLSRIFFLGIWSYKMSLLFLEVLISIFTSKSIFGVTLNSEKSRSLLCCLLNFWFLFLASVTLTRSALWLNLGFVLVGSSQPGLIYEGRHCLHESFFAGLLVTIFLFFFSCIWNNSCILTLNKMG